MASTVLARHEETVTLRKVAHKTSCRGLRKKAAAGRHAAAAAPPPGKKGHIRQIRLRKVGR